MVSAHPITLHPGKCGNVFFIREDAWNKIIYWPCLEVYMEDFLWVSVVTFTAIPSVTTGSSDPCFIQLLYYYKYSNLSSYLSSSSFLAKNISSLCTCRTTQTSAGLICKTMRKLFFLSFCYRLGGTALCPFPVACQQSGQEAHRSVIEIWHMRGQMSTDTHTHRQRKLGN